MKDLILLFSSNIQILSILEINLYPISFPDKG